MVFNKNRIDQFFLVVVLFFCSCDGDQKSITDISIFENTVSWELAQSVNNIRINKIKTILNDDSSLADIVDPEFGISLLEWAVKAKKVASVKALLLNGADPNIRSESGRTPLLSSVGLAWAENMNNQDDEILRILLENGADPNLCFFDYSSNENLGISSIIENETSPLMYAINFGNLKKVKLLIEAGADIDYKTYRGNTAAVASLLMQKVEIAHYLIVKQKATITNEFYALQVGNSSKIDSSKVHRPVMILENWIFEIGSYKHLLKMEIINEFSNQGINYWNEQKSERILQQIKVLYPDTWQVYLREY